MQDPTLIQVSKPLKWYNKQVNCDFKKLMVTVTKAVIMQIAGKSDSAAKELAETFNTIKLSEDISELAYNLILRSMINAVHKLSTENVQLFDNDIAEMEKLYDDKNYIDFLDGINSVLDYKELSIGHHHLKHPAEIEIIRDFGEYLQRWLPKLGISPVDAKQLSHRLPDYFVLSFHEEWSENPDKYEVLYQKLASPASEDVKRIFEWQHYYSLLRKEVQKGIFDESFSLRQIYVPLRAEYEVKEEVQREGEENKEKVFRVAVNLEEELNEWLSNTNMEDCIKALSGGPGSGKSSFAKIWAAKLTQRADIKVIFVPLHLLDLTEQFDSSLARFFKDNIEIPLTYPSPLLEIKDKTVIILDGLDELSEQGAFAENIAEKFISMLHRVNLRLNSKNKIRFQFLITGRRIIIDKNRTELRRPAQILQLLPYHFPLSESDREDWKNWELLEVDQRDVWWEKYGRLTGTGYLGVPPEMKNNEKLADIMVQPLLNYLVSVTLRRKKMKITKEITLNSIYRDLIEGVYERNYANPHVSLKGLSRNHFSRALEEIAITAWHSGNNRTATIPAIEANIEESGLKPILEKFAEGAKEGISRLLLAFFFKEHKNFNSGSEKFEFTHKSFGEFLSAVRIVRLIKNLNEDIKTKEELLDKGLTLEQALIEWSEVLGANSLDHYILSFLHDEIARYPNELVEEWQQMFARLIKFTITKGIPFQRRIKHQEEMQKSRNAEEALLILHWTCCDITDNQDHLDLSGLGQISVSSWIVKLSLHDPTLWETLPRQRINKLALNHLYLASVPFPKTDFSNASLVGVHLDISTLFETNFEGANLEGASLAVTNLFGANFTKASLVGASLGNSDLESAYFDEANLSQSSLTGIKAIHTSFEDCNLEGANLVGSILINTNFKGANLTESNLSHANFKNADLRNAYLTNSILEMTDFTNANLRGCKGLNYNQLIKVESLRNTKGLRSDLKKKLIDSHPQLF